MEPKSIFKSSLTKTQPLLPNTKVSKNDVAESDSEIVVITSCSEDYFPRLLNLIGSIHMLETTIRIAVYDLGLSKKQVKDLTCIENVEIQTLDTSKWPKHAR